MPKLVREKNNGEAEIKNAYSGIVSAAVKARADMTIDRFVPRPGNILCEPLPPDEMIGSIVLPDAAKSESGLHVVITSAVEGIETGDIVLSYAGAGLTIEIEKRDLRVLQVSGDVGDDILGIWKLNPQSLDAKAAG